jgi:hypothetical protein
MGGEIHTFTKVKKFGGGFVDTLNQASENPMPAPECAQSVNGVLTPQAASADNTMKSPISAVFIRGCGSWLASATITTIITRQIKKTVVRSSGLGKCGLRTDGSV